MEKSGLLVDEMCVVSFVIQSKLNLVSVAFAFNASLNDFAPVSPIPLPVDFVYKLKNEQLLDIVCISMCSLVKSSSVSVVFTFNASPNDVAPVSSILLAVLISKKSDTCLCMCK